MLHLVKLDSGSSANGLRNFLLTATSEQKWGGELMSRALISASVLIVAAVLLPMQRLASQTTGEDNPDARPPVTKADARIVQRAHEILNSESKWNRADTRDCPADAKTFSLYCALEKATNEVSGKFEHRGAAMQEARFVIDEIAPNRKNYNHRLMDYNNDPTTTYADIQKFFRVLEDRVTKRLREEDHDRKSEK
jgi:hypothetical protein